MWKKVAFVRFEENSEEEETIDRDVDSFGVTNDSISTLERTV